MSLVLEGVTAGYDGRVIISDARLTVQAGQIVGLCGPSGVGKSTLGRVACGLLEPSAGEVLVDGTPVSTRRGHMDGRVGMLFQSPRRSAPPRVRLGDLIAEPIRLRINRSRAGGDRRAVAQVVADLAREVGLTSDLLERLPSEVSDGQLQRACLARTLAGGPRYLVSDEATAMLDAVSTAGIAELIRARADSGLGVLAISHDRELLDAWADEVHDIRDLTSDAAVTLPRHLTTGV